MRIGAPRAAIRPCVAGDDETIPWYVYWIEIRSKILALYVVELSVDQHPAGLLAIPVFTHPMVFKLARREIRGEAASSSRRNSLSTQHAAEHQRKMPAHARHAALRFSCGVEWLDVERKNSREHFR